MEWGWVRWLVARAWFPVAFQIGLLVVGGILTVLAFGVGPGLDDEQLHVLRKTNLTTLLVWGMWWPGLVAATVLFGRVWCTVCPLELVARVGGWVARRLGVPRAKLWRLLRNGWAVVFGYLTLQVLVATAGLHHVPHATALLVIALVGLALATGFVFKEPRSFCKGFCPAGALLSVYGRFTRMQLDVVDPEVCRTCQTKDCVTEANRHRFDRRSCPSLIKPFAREPGDGCVLCFQCAKVCPHDNIGFGLVTDGSPLAGRTLLRPFEAAFVMVVIGFLAHELAEEVEWFDELFHFVPSHLASLAPGVPFGWIEAGWYLLLFPAAIWTVQALLGYAAGYRGRLKDLLLAAATGAAPIVALAHLTKAIQKITEWIWYVPLALRDPEGVRTMDALARGLVPEPEPMVGLSPIAWVMAAAMLVVAVKAWRWVKDVPQGQRPVARVAMVSASVIYAIIFGVWAIGA